MESSRPSVSTAIMPAFLRSGSSVGGFHDDAGTIRGSCSPPLWKFFSLSLATGALYSVDLSGKIPGSLTQIFDYVVFLSGPPNVFNGIAKIKIHVFNYGDALDAGRMRVVMFWMIDCVGCFIIEFINQFAR
jgi:hypothetical protein